MRKHGFSAAGTQRYRCVLCSVSTVRKRPDIRDSVHARRFQRWLCDGVRTKIVAQIEKVSSRTIRISLDIVLKVNPDTTCLVSEVVNELPLLIDGTYIQGRSRCVLIAYDTKNVVGFALSKRENYESWIWLLSRLQGKPLCIVSDGHSGAESAVIQVFGDSMPIQRCIVHVRRRAFAILTRNPQTDAGKELKVLVYDLYYIHSETEKESWLQRYKEWNTKHSEFLKQRSYRTEYIQGKRMWWYTHRSIRAVRSHIHNALPYLFTYLTDTRIPKSTNALEGGINSTLKTLFREHRGIAVTKKLRVTYEFLKRRMR